MTLELVAVILSGVLAAAAAGIVTLARRHITPSGTVEIVPRKSGDKIRVVKSSHGEVTSIEITNPSAAVRDILDV
jgi:hypothetical protein